MRLSIIQEELRKQRVFALEYLQDDDLPDTDADRLCAFVDELTTAIDAIEQVRTYGKEYNQ